MKGRTVPDEIQTPPETAEGARKWYTVREAAEYLGVNEPTLFRWMKEGAVTYYKVGGATRFSQENLDILFEKNTGSKEAQLLANRCTACGHTTLVEGRLRGAGQLYFRPDKSAFWVLAEAMTPTRARVCAACGYMHLYADTTKLKKLKPKPAEDKTRAED
ncbi:MAG TPA: helix-turn-helix domain-containing protein [Anaerohalosphaeraceae bacterium]|nr:helix-turn-helix domain-containing protein [Anaerohalosphaeraceae bacterium]HRT51435.1 helix-turn-helix domain-containing protein [Anaerohalosphaeraceae bacterium]HRT87494.1 helix-turn-helix domain-containing protein [Anaerohalosphaeraceae bacterium]